VRVKRRFKTRPQPRRRARTGVAKTGTNAAPEAKKRAPRTTPVALRHTRGTWRSSYPSPGQ